MIWVDTDEILFEFEGKCADWTAAELVLLKVWPAPDTRVDHVWKAFAAGDLKTTVQRTLNGHASRRVGTARRDCGDESVKLVSLIFELLDKRFNRTASK